jgi:hypothetical protein
MNGVVKNKRRCVMAIRFKLNIQGKEVILSYPDDAKTYALDFVCNGLEVTYNWAAENCERVEEKCGHNIPRTDCMVCLTTPNPRRPIPEQKVCGCKRLECEVCHGPFKPAEDVEAWKRNPMPEIMPMLEPGEYTEVWVVHILNSINNLKDCVADLQQRVARMEK